MTGGTEDRWPHPMRRLLPRTFQGRLTVAFVGVVALVLLLVSTLVLNRLDDYFRSQQETDLAVANETVSVYVQSVAATYTFGGAGGRGGRHPESGGRHVLSRESQRRSSPITWPRPTWSSTSGSSTPTRTRNSCPPRTGAS